jgi:hypothetical protein
VAKGIGTRLPVEETLTMTPPAAAQHVRQRRVAAIHYADQIRLD